MRISLETLILLLYLLEEYNKLLIVMLIGYF